ncbi:MAG: pyruvate dehydrogenase complex dihydrolipoamide acetyltransferase [Phycisphaerae bacterium]|nr:pyruvate dehydrogenase complex dihydrolipoamide acetyltransferase [Phycisphaerae bacterium]|tara:strand:+ start:260 stop:1603 length:1344 start_codon:yes stop_codon:yes gene_type:complete
MTIEITMPRLSDTMEKGTIIKWHIAEGDEVSAGDVLADVETDKATMEMQSFDDGTVNSLAVDEGQAVEVGTVVAVLLEEDESADDVSSTPAAPAASSPSTEPDKPAEVAPAPQAAERQPTRGSDGQVRISPVARRLAEAHGVDVNSLVGSGPSGRIVKRDVLAAAGAGEETRSAVAPAAKPAQRSMTPPPTAVPATPVAAAPEQSSDLIAIPGSLQSHREPVTGMRQTIAQRLVDSKQSIPHYQVSMTFNVDPLMALRSSLNSQLAGTGSKISVNDLLVRACALAMYANPLMNASWAGDSIVYHGDVNIGVAIALPQERGGGLVVATIRNADRKSIRVISAETKALSEKARTRGLTVDEMADSTFTISNLGMFGVDDFTAIINPPNSAILAAGAAIQKPVVRDGELAVGYEMNATLSNDHRVVDGATAAQYLVSLREYIENPAQILV